jgi:hypothetical protein
MPPTRIPALRPMTADFQESLRCCGGSCSGCCVMVSPSHESAGLGQPNGLELSCPAEAGSATRTPG